MALPFIVLSVLVLIGIYKFIVYPVFLSPLRKLPSAHWTASFSSLWILNERRQYRETTTVHEAHKRYGPIIRLAPNEISINSVDGGIRTVYGGGYEKGDWYSNVFENYGIQPMFTMAEARPHSKRKRMVSNVYAKSTLQSSQGIPTILKVLLDDRLVPILRNWAKEGKDLEIYEVFSAITLDFVSAYVFGLAQATDHIRDPTFGKQFFRTFKARQLFVFWLQETPVFTSILAKLGLRWLVIPTWVPKANVDIEDWLLDICNRSEGVMQRLGRGDETSISPENYPTVYAQLRQAMIKEYSENSQSKLSEKDLESANAIAQQNMKVMASEFLDHVLAGFDTSSITLVFLAWELSKPENNQWQTRLREELSQVSNRHDPKSIDALPILHAILMETLRLHAAVPGNQPRVTPAGATLGAPGHAVSNLPANVRVQAQAWSLHREPSVFPDPESWNPARWLDADAEQAKEMARWFWAFGSGGRMCVGSNLAMLDMKAIIAAIWSAFRTVLVDGEGMVHAGGFVAEPKGKDGKYCVLRLEELQA